MNGYEPTPNPSQEGNKLTAQVEIFLCDSLCLLCVLCGKKKPTPQNMLDTEKRK